MGSQANWMMSQSIAQKSHAPFLVGDDSMNLSKISEISMAQSQVWNVGPDQGKEKFYNSQMIPSK
jgi:hypothetical protein